MRSSDQDIHSADPALESSSVDSDCAAAKRSRPTARKRLFFRIILIFATVALCEGGARVVMAFRLGPSVLLYGLPFERAKILRPKLKDAPWYVKAGKRENLQQRAGYTKYKPHQVRYIWDEQGKRWPVKINAQGFRGEEFETQKAPGVFRIVTLGASSTFGYHDRDNETYPYYLEQQLNAWLGDNPQPGIERFEVLNLGIPHLDSAEILALFDVEVPPLDADLVTFYEGANDTRNLPTTLGERTLRRLASRLVLAELGQQIRTNHFERFDEDRFLEANAWMPQRALGNLDGLADACAALEIRMMLVTQQSRSLTMTPEQLRQTDYAGEIELIRGRLRDRGWIDHTEVSFLLHSEIVAAQREWVASRDDVELVDALAAVDAAARRDTLVSWVHLNGDGNRIVADAIAKKVVNSLFNSTVN